MSHYMAPIQDIKFVMQELAGLDGIARLPGYEEADRDVVEQILDEAAKFNVLPLDDRRVERFDADMAGRPKLIHGTTQVLYGGMQRLSEASVINVKNRSHTITAEVEIPSGGANGVVIAQAGRFAGWSLYFTDGKPAYVHNWIGRERYTVAAAEAVAADVAREMNEWARGFFGRPIVGDWQKQLDFTTKIFRARGLHLDDRHVRCADGSGFSASIVKASWRSR